MPMEGTVEQRLTALEFAMTEIQHRLASQPPATDWVSRFDGSFQDEPAFAEVVALGRAVREADRPREDNGP